MKCVQILEKKKGEREKKHFFGNIEPSVNLVYSELLQNLISDLKYAFPRAVSLPITPPYKAAEKSDSCQNRYL